MAQARQSFSIARPKSEVHQFLSDPGALGGCLSFVAETEYDEGWTWLVKSPMSTITSTPSLALEFEADTTGSITWEGTGNHLETRGEILLRDNGNGETEVDFTLEMRGLGPLSVVIEPMASVQIGNQIDYFAQCVREELA